MRKRGRTGRLRGPGLIDVGSMNVQGEAEGAANDAACSVSRHVHAGAGDEPEGDSHRGNEKRKHQTGFLGWLELHIPQVGNR